MRNVADFVQRFLLTFFFFFFWIMINYNIWFLPRFKKNIEIKHQRTYIWWAESRDAPRHLRTCRLETETIATGPLWSRTYSRTKEKSQRVNARGKRERAGMPRSLLSSTPSLALPILSSKSREPSVYIATRVERQRRPVINVYLGRDALHETLKKEKNKKQKETEKGEGTKGERVTRGSLSTPLCSFLGQIINVAPCSLFLKF